MDVTNTDNQAAMEHIRTILNDRLENEGGQAGTPSVPPEALESMYSMAYAAYSVENYAEAETLFMGVIMFNASDVRAWLGYAGACEAQKKWLQGLEGYAGALGLTPEDPIPAYRAGLCCMALDDAENARKAFVTAAALKESVVGDPVRSRMAQRAESMIRLLDDKAGQA